MQAHQAHLLMAMSRTIVLPEKHTRSRRMAEYNSKAPECCRSSWTAWLAYQAAVKERYFRQKMQAAQNADISKSNDQALKYAELTNTHPPPMRQAVWEDFPEPVRPQPAVSGRQQAAAAAAAAAGAQASDRAAVAPTPYTVMPQGRQLAFTPALVRSEAAALHAGTAVSGSRGRGPNGQSVTGIPANPEGAGS